MPGVTQTGIGLEGWDFSLTLAEWMNEDGGRSGEWNSGRATADPGRELETPALTCWPDRRNKKMPLCLMRGNENRFRRSLLEKRQVAEKTLKTRKSEKLAARRYTNRDNRRQTIKVRVGPAGENPGFEVGTYHYRRT